MAITYPRSLPFNGARMQEAWFDLLDTVAASPSGRNQTLVNMSQTDDPVWLGKFITPPLDVADQAVWGGWRKSLRGLNTFLAYDVRRLAPLAYAAAKAPGDIQVGWDGTASVEALGLSGAMELSGLPANYAFKVGDRIGLEQGGHYGYYEVVEDATADAGGAIEVVTVAPFLHTSLFNNTAVCRLWRPLCQFILEQSSWSEQGTKEASPG